MIEIKVGGAIFGGWKTARIQFGIEQIANSFELEVTDRWPDQKQPRPINRGESCQVLIDNEVVITGYVDESNPELDEKAHGIAVSGRDVTGDLVDCSAIHKSGQWARSTLDKIVRDICKPFGIPVVVDAPVGDVFATFSIQEGETAHECIERACRMRAVLPISDGKGNLVITRAKSGEPVASIIEGENLKYAKADLSMRERFSRYIIKGQDRGSDDDFDTPENHSQPTATAQDDFVKRYRPLIVMAEDLGATASFKQRAEWERNVRRGRSSRATVRVNGWRNATGALWKANSLVYFYSPIIGADANLLIVSGTYILDEQMGQITELQLVGREAFDLLSGVKTSGLKRAIKGKNGAAAASGDSTKKSKSNTTDWSNF